MTRSRLTGLARLEPSVRRALDVGAPVVALESALITHGLPYPDNLGVARGLEAEVRANGAMPATVAVLRGELRVGLSDSELEQLATAPDALKISTRDLSSALTRSLSGGTTVAATMQVASGVGIHVFATGGIGGVHRESAWDVSSDLHALSRLALIVVCAGAKAILNLSATLEYLETMGVPVVGYGTDEFPAFYSRASGLSTSARLDSPEDVARFASTHWKLGNISAVLVANPIHPTDEIPRGTIEPIIERASREAAEQGISGSAVTPFLLQRVAELSAGRSVTANRSLLLNNAGLAARIAAAVPSARARAL